MVEHIFILTFAGTENHQLYIHRRQQLIHHISDQIKSFLVCHTRYDTNQKSVFSLWKTKLLLESCFVFLLSDKYILTTEIGVNIRIDLRIILFVINSVKDTVETVSSGTHESIESLATFHGRNLFRIGRAYRRYCICIYNTALQIVCLSIRFQFTGIKNLFWKSCNIHNFLYSPSTLKLHIVDGIDGLHSGIEIVIAICGT